MVRFIVVLTLVLYSSVALEVVEGAEESPVLRLATFDVDATPPLGSPVAYAPVRSIVDPLHARGIVLLPGGQSPIVLVAVDWIGIANGGQDVWRKSLSEAAGTDLDRVAVHTLHQHDGPRFDTAASELFAKPDQAAKHVDLAWSRQVIDRTADAVRQAIKRAQPISHIGTGRAAVKQVASNRRILGPDGKVAHVRWSRCTDPEVRAAPEGVIDPNLRLVSFWNGSKAVACLAYYATHPMSHYGQGDVSADFVGLARAQRDLETGVLHVYFTGAGGNVAAGKYNDGSPPMRQVLQNRMADAMQRAWDATRREPLAAGDVGWKVEPVALPPAAHLNAAELRRTLSDDKSTDQQQLAAASNLAWLNRRAAGRTIGIQRLKLGRVFIVHMPGELFVEYQLAASTMRPQDFVCMAAYGDYGPGYIGTQIAYGQGGYETSPRASRVAPEVEAILMAALRRVLIQPDKGN